MRRRQIILTLALILFSLCGLLACGAKDSYSAGQIKVWVGGESQVFYDEVLNNDYKEYFKEKYGKEFPYSFKVVGVDAGGAAAQFLNDTTAGADIFTVPHDNLGKLLDGSTSIAPVEDEELIEQMEAQNPDSFLDVCWLAAGDGSDAAYYAVPYISQSLFLVYNKSVFAGKEDKLKTWEGIMEVATAENTKATAFMGSDGFNFSSFILAQPKSEDAIQAFGKNGTLRVYQNGSVTNCYNWGDDQVAVQKWVQRFILNDHGRRKKIITDDGFDKELRNFTLSTKTAGNSCITAVIGAWKIGQIRTALPDNWGATVLPSFTLTEADAYGAAKAGMEFYTGTFADCKCFVKKAGSRYSAYLDDIMKFLSSDAIQERSFKEASNLPASQNAKLEGSVESLQVAQAQMDSALHSIAQPFGYQAKFNQYYYQSGGPGKYEAIATNNGSKYSTDAQIKRKLVEACYVWTHGKDPAVSVEKSDDKNLTLEQWLTSIGYENDIASITIAD